MKISHLVISPKIMQSFHMVQVLLWTVMIPVTLATPLLHSVPFLVLISILAIVSGELSAWQASLTERRLDTTDDFGDEEQQ